MNAAPRKPILHDHKRIRKKLIPPAINALGARTHFYSWNREIVSEFIWLALLVECHGYREAREYCEELVATSARVSRGLPKPMYSNLSSYRTLSNSEKASVISALSPRTLSALRSALQPLCEISADHPLSFLDHNSQVDYSTKDRLTSVLQDTYDRNGRLSVLSMALAYYLGLKQGLISLSEHLIGDLETAFVEIEDYPNTDASTVAAGRFRAAVPFLVMTPDDSSDLTYTQNSTEWRSSFWENVSGLGPCVYEDTLIPYEIEEAQQDQIHLTAFHNAVKADLKSRLEQWKLDLEQIEIYEVVSALLCRQSTLAIELSSSPAVWTPNTAPIILRCMADVYISLAWLLKDPSSRAKRYVEDGMGAVKLELAHRKQELNDLSEDQDVKGMQTIIVFWESWLRAQRMSEFIEVNLGTWSGLTARKMAEESGVLDFYNYVYQPFSSAVHSNWAHVSILNLTHCENPAHRSHRVPAVFPFDPDPYWLYLTAKYLDKTFCHFDSEHNLADMPHEALNTVLTWFSAGTATDHVAQDQVL